MQEAALPHEWQTPDGIVDAFALCATREDAGRFFSAANGLG